MRLSTDLFNALVHTLTSLLRTEAERERRLDAAFHDAPAVWQALDPHAESPRQYAGKLVRFLEERWLGDEWALRRYVETVWQEAVEDGRSDLADTLLAYVQQVRGYEVLRQQLRGAGLDPEQATADDAFTGGKYVETGGAAAVESSVHVTKGDFVGRDKVTYVIQQVTAGLAPLPTDYGARIHNFLVEYLGTEEEKVPFGGRREQLAALDRWLADPTAPPYALLVSEAGRGKSALLACWVNALVQHGDYHVVLVPVSVRFGLTREDDVFTALAARLGGIYDEPIQWSNFPPGVWRGICEEFLKKSPPDGRPLVVVLDGLDEAAGWQLDAGFFPADPPSGVRAVAAARQLAGVDLRGWRRRLGWDRRGRVQPISLPLLDEAGLRDVLREMRDPLNELVTNLDKAEVVRQLHRLSEGDPIQVRLYVEALLDERERVAFLKPDDLAAIPPGLDGYFGEWERHQQILWGAKAPLREHSVRTVRNLLAAALGPLTREDLLSLAEFPPAIELDSDLLDEAVTPFQRFIVGDGTVQGYVFSHPRLGYHFWDKLSARERNGWNARFLAWGEATLRALNDGALQPQAAPRYIVQHYGTHLDPPSERKITAAPDYSCYALVSEGWMRAWEALEGTYTGFLNDVERARKRAQAGFPEAADRPLRLAMQVKGALCRSSLAGYGNNLPPDLLREAVENNYLTPTQALAFVAQTPTEKKQSEALISLISILPESSIPAALSMVREFKSDRSRADVIKAVAKFLAPASISEVILILPSIDDEGERLSAFKSIVRNCPDELIDESLHIALGFVDAWCATCALTSVLPRLSGDTYATVLSKAIATANMMEVGDVWRKTEAFLNIISHISGNRKNEMIVQAVLTAFHTESTDQLARLLSNLSKHLPLNADDSWQTRMKEVARWIIDEDERTNFDSQVSKRLMAEGWADVSTNTTRLSDTIAPELQTWLGDLSSRALQPQHITIDEAEMYARKNSKSKRGQIQLVLSLASHIVDMQPSDLLQRLLITASRLEDTSEQSLILRKLSLYVHSEQLQEILLAAEASAQVIEDDLERARALASLLPLLQSDWKATVLLQALKAARNIDELKRRVWALLSIADHMTDQQEHTIILQEAVMSAALIEDEPRRKSMIEMVTKHVPLKLQDTVLGDLVNHRIIRLPFEQKDREQTMKGLLDAAATRGFGSHFGQTVQALAPFLSSTLIEEALSIARSLNAIQEQATALTLIIPCLPNSQRASVLEETLALVENLTDEFRRYDILAKLAPYLGEYLAREALGIVRKFESEEYKANLLAVFAARLPEKDRLQLVQEALTLTQMVDEADWWSISTQILLSKLVPAQEKTGLLRQVLTQLRDVYIDPISQEEILLTLKSELVGELVGEFMETVIAITSESDKDYRYDMLTILVEPAVRWARHDLSAAFTSWTKILVSLSSLPRPEFLNDLAVLMPFALALAGDEAPEAAQGIFEAIQEVCAWWP